MQLLATQPPVDSLADFNRWGFVDGGFLSLKCFVSGQLCFGGFLPVLQLAGRGGSDTVLVPGPGRYYRINTMLMS